MQKNELDVAASTARVPTLVMNAFKKQLIDQGLSFQVFVETCIRAYLHDDPDLRKTMKTWRIDNPREFVKSWQPPKPSS